MGLSNVGSKNETATVSKYLCGVRGGHLDRRRRGPRTARGTGAGGARGCGCDRAPERQAAPRSRVPGRGRQVGRARELLRRRAAGDPDPQLLSLPDVVRPDAERSGGRSGGNGVDPGCGVRDRHDQHRPARDRGARARRRSRTTSNASSALRRRAAGTS